MITLDQLTRKIEDLPPMPDIISKLMAASNNPDVSMKEMVDLIKLDPALTAKVLRLCNSSFYGLPRTVNSIQEALVYIGIDTLVNYILSGCLANYYQSTQSGYGLESGGLWSHSVACALASARLARDDPEDAGAGAYTAGLLHDVGKIILDEYVAQAFDEILLHVEKENISFEEAERVVLGYSHADAGAEMAKSWNLPDSLVEAIQFHHDPEQAPEHHRLAAQVHLGNIVCLSFGIGVGSDGLAYSFQSKALDYAGLDIESLQRISVEVYQEYCKAEELVGTVS